ncbi:hypothetical protein [Microbacterium sp. bgisy189]
MFRHGQGESHWIEAPFVAASAPLVARVGAERVGRAPGSLI